MDWKEHTCGLERQRNVPENQVSLQLLGHEPDKLALLLVQNALKLRTAADRSTMQASAFQRFQRLMSEGISPMWTSSELRKFLERVARLFDEMFFFGNLMEYCVIGIHRNPETNAYGYTRTHQDDPNFDYFKDKPWAICMIRCLCPTEVVAYDLGELRPMNGLTATLLEMNRQNWDELISSYLGTLLHELLHAVFDIFTCSCKEKCESTRWRYAGNTGHGSGWIHTYKSIGVACRALGLAERVGDCFDADINVAFDEEKKADKDYREQGDEQEQDQEFAEEQQEEYEEEYEEEHEEEQEEEDLNIRNLVGSSCFCM